MTLATKTINPLHFEDLEPHRFEDLVRQLVYDYREWASLEATGRQGADDGFDARGWENTKATSSSPDEDESEDGTEEKNEDDRVWLIQCKREKTITPKKLVSYLDGLDTNEVSTLHGLIFVASCDFSKKSRDNFRRWCGDKGINEFHIWGRAELEDMLFLPKYDHLLFAYFGISLHIRKRSIKTKLRSTLTIKRKAIRHLGDVSGYSRERVLLRDPDAHEYPYSGEVNDFDELPTWRVYDFIGHYHAGIKILIKTHFAYIDIDNDEVKWDYDEHIRTNQRHDNPWPIKEDTELEMKARSFWSKLPEENQATLEVIGLIPYDDILAIDEHGDNHFNRPQIYVNFDLKQGPFSAGAYAKLVTYNPTRRTYPANKEDKIKYFPGAYPEIEDDKKP